MPCASTSASAIRSDLSSRVTRRHRTPQTPRSKKPACPDGPRRPSELKRALPEASERVLAQQLSELMEYGVVEKQVIDPVCKHSEYSLTDLGRTLIPIIEQMRTWGNDFRPTLQQILQKKEA